MLSPFSACIWNVSGGVDDGVIVGVGVGVFVGVNVGVFGD
jgi:hypothetical protein